MLVDVHNTLVINALMRWGSDEIQQRYLPRLASDAIGAYALSEAGSGSDAFAMTTRAVERDDGWALTGRKLWITNASEAEVFIVFANANPEAGYRGITAFLVERGFAGLQRGKKEDKLGIRASSTCELVLEDCRVPRANVIGEVGKGYKAAIETLNEGRIGIGAQMIGLAQGALDHTITYTQERRQFGKSIAEFQAVRHQIARAATELQAARLMVYEAARLRDAGRPFLTEAAMCKIFSSEVAERVTSLAVNLFGGNGFVKDYPVEKLFRDAKIGQIYEGTSNLQLETIAKQILETLTWHSPQAISPTSSAPFAATRCSAKPSIAQVSDHDLHTLVDPEANSIAIIVKHLAGNFRSRFTDFLTTDGEKPDRDRDHEFVMTERPSRAQIIEWRESGWTVALGSLEALTADDLERTVRSAERRSRCSKRSTDRVDACRVSRRSNRSAGEAFRRPGLEVAQHSERRVQGLCARLVQARHRSPGAKRPP